MMNIKKLPVKMITIIALSSVFLAACDDTRVRVSASTANYHGGGHYLSHTPHNHRVRYDTALGLYALIGLSNVYWDNGNYYRYNNNGWQRSRDYSRWNAVTVREVPNRLYTRYYKPPIYDRSRVRISPDNNRRGRVDRNGRVYYNYR